MTQRSQERLLIALEHQNAGRYQTAEALFREELVDQPRSFAALYSLAAIANAQGRNHEALAFIDRALAVLPNYIAAHEAKSSILRALGRLEESAQWFIQARKLEALGHEGANQLAPQVVKLTIDHPKQTLGLRYQEEGRSIEAQAVFEELLKERPKDFVALYSLAVIYAQQGNVAQALETIDRALLTNPVYPAAHFARGTLLQQLGLFEEALASFNQANQLDPSYLDAWNNKASLFQSLSREEEAFQCLDQALRYNPQDEKLLHNAGTILTVLKRDTEAIKYFDKLLSINPSYEYAAGYRLFAKLHTCNWENFEEERQEMIESVRQGMRVINPLAFFSISEDPADQLKCSQIFAASRYPASKDPLWHGERYRHRKVRIGYLSPDFREHPVGHLMVGVIEQHDRARFETFGFSLGVNDGSSLRRRFRLGFDHFLDCKERTSTEIAQLIRATEIDILVDLAGYTASARPEVLAQRPAPIQINYLGFPGTMGAPWVDYIVADQVVIPEGFEQFYQEKILRLPCCYLPIDDQISPSPETPSRESMGLPSKGTVYCSFNHDYKINPPVWDVWMDLLRQDRGSTLWLMKLNEAAEANLRKEAQIRDINPKRLVFATRVPRIEDHLARYRLIDVFLDTMPYNAHSTVTDVIRSGGQVVTLQGKTFASRVAASYIKHTEASLSTITESLAEYKDQLAHSRLSRTKKLGDEAQHKTNTASAATMARYLEEAFLKL